jgi:hypothetical protein
VPFLQGLPGLVEDEFAPSDLVLAGLWVSGDLVVGGLSVSEIERRLPLRQLGVLDVVRGVLKLAGRLPTGGVEVTLRLDGRLLGLRELLLRLTDLVERLLMGVRGVADRGGELLLRAGLSYRAGLRLPGCCPGLLLRLLLRLKRRLDMGDRRDGHGRESAEPGAGRAKRADQRHDPSA